MFEGSEDGLEFLAFAAGVVFGFLGESSSDRGEGWG